MEKFFVAAEYAGAIVYRPIILGAITKVQAGKNNTEGCYFAEIIKEMDGDLYKL